MPVKIRLQRRGKKGQPFYHVVIADSRAPRDGRFIEKIGTYNPLTHPSTIVLNFDRAYHWINCGAQPTETARMILQKEGLYLKQHLMKGVQKGALTDEQANAKLAQWKEEKAHKLNDIKLEVSNSEKMEKQKRIEAEVKVKEAKAAIVHEKRQAILAAEAAKKAEEQMAAEAAAKAKAEAEAKTKAEAETKTENQEITSETQPDVSEIVTPETIEQTTTTTENTPATE
ncbi:MAG: 30S ribosomal protein S16 [Bacteroidales bacterium]|jgi:small subunit ribosomal protein S16|nr:30S ribosomal protein S16 [Bacteroidales bacterium]